MHKGTSNLVECYRITYLGAYISGLTLDEQGNKMLGIAGPLPAMADPRRAPPVPDLRRIFPLTLLDIQQSYT